MSKIKKSKSPWPYNLMEKIFDDNLDDIKLYDDIEGCIEYYCNKYGRCYLGYNSILMYFRDNKSIKIISSDESYDGYYTNTNSIRHHIGQELTNMKHHKRLFEIGIEKYEEEKLNEFLDTKLKDSSVFDRWDKRYFDLDYTMRELILFSKNDLKRSGLYESTIDIIVECLNYRGLKLSETDKKIEGLRDLFLNETAYNLLINNGITSIESLIEYSEADLKRLFGSSYNIVPDIEKKLKSCNLSLSKNNKIITSIPDVKNWIDFNVFDKLLELYNVIQYNIISVSTWRIYKSDNICFRINADQYRRLYDTAGSKHSIIEIYYINNNITIIGYHNDSSEKTIKENINILDVEDTLLDLIEE